MFTTPVGIPAVDRGRVQWDWGREIAIPGPEYQPSLLLFTPVLLGKNFVKDLTKEAQAWQRKVRLQGGDWQGTFRIYADEATLTDYFYNWLGYHLEESVQGVVSWRGMLYEMTLNTHNASRTRSLDQMYNHVRTKWNDGTDHITSASLVQASIDRYGRREAIEDAAKTGSALAAAGSATYLAEHAWPWSRPQASGGEGIASLDVTVCGYIFTANWRHTTTDDDATDTIHDWMVDILTNDCATFLTPGNIWNNTTTITRTVEGYERCWDLMLKRLVKMGDAGGALYRAYVRGDRYFYYEQITTEPNYYIVKGMLSSRLEAAEALNPWFVQPGVFRDMDYTMSYQEQGSYLADVRDLIVEEVSVGVNSGLSWQALDFSESAQLAAYQEYVKVAAPAKAKPKKKKKKKKKK